MPNRRHKKDTKNFGELTFAEQAKSISADIINLQKAIEHHVNHPDAREDTLKKCLEQIERLHKRLKEKYGASF